MMGTVWLRLEAKQESIIPLINGLFFGSAFMSFMAVAYCGYLSPIVDFRFLTVYRPRIPRRLPSVHQGEAQWPVRRHRAHHLQLSDRYPLSVYVLQQSEENVRLLTLCSPHLAHLLVDFILAVQLSAHRSRILHLGVLAVPRSAGGRGPRSLHDIALPLVRHLARARRFCQRTMDECRWLHGTAGYPERILQIRLPLLGLPEVRV